MEPNHTATFEVAGLVRFAQVPKWLIRHPALSPGAKTLYADIMSYADNDTKAAFPSRQTLAKDLNVSVRSITNYIQELESVQAMTVTRGRKNKRTGNYYANHYVLHWENPCAKNVPPQGAENVPLTTPTISTTPTSPIASDLPITAPALPPVGATGAHSTDDRLGISKEAKYYLISEAVKLYEAGDRYWDDEGGWYAFTEEIETITGADVGDLIANKRFDERLGELIFQHREKGPRYGASAWLGTLINTAIAD